MALKLALEPLFFFALEFFQNDRLNISSWGIYFGITTTTTLENTWFWHQHFYKRTLFSELETIIGSSTTVSDLSICNNSCSNLWPFQRDWVVDDRRSFWQVLGTQSKKMASSYQTNQTESEEKRQCNGCFDEEHRRRDEEIVTNCKLVRDVIESQRENKKRKAILKFEELFEKLKGRWANRTKIQAEHDERLLEALV